MAELQLEGGELVLHLSGAEKAEAVCGHGEKVFVAVHGDTPRGVRVRLEGCPLG